MEYLILMISVGGGGQIFKQCHSLFCSTHWNYIELEGQLFIYKKSGVGTKSSQLFCHTFLKSFKNAWTSSATPLYLRLNILRAKETFFRLVFSYLSPTWTQLWGGIFTPLISPLIPNLKNISRGIINLMLV